jgi:hypothetical protein
MPSLVGLDLNAATPTGAHYGVNADASTPIGLIALSRLARTKDASTLERMASSPFGVALLTALRSLTLRVALAAGFDRGLSDANVIALFNLPGSSTKYQSQYGDFGSLQSRLAWLQYKRLVTALLEALTTARQGQVGYGPGQLMLTSFPATPLDAAGQTAIATLATAVEQSMLTRLRSGDAGGAGASSSSSSSSSRRTTPPPLPQPPAPPRLSSPPPPQAPAAFAIDPTQSLSTNLARLVASRARRQLSPPEAAALAAALDDGLSVFQAGDAAARQQLLATNVLVALTNPSAAWLWAATAEAVEHPTSSIATLAAAVVDYCSNTAAMLFADAAADFTTEAVAGAARSPLKALHLEAGAGGAYHSLSNLDARSEHHRYARKG